MRWMLLAVFCTTLTVHGQELKPRIALQDHPAAQGKTSSDADGQKVIPGNQQTPRGQENNHSAKPPSYLHELFLAPNLPNILLVIVGIGGIIAAVFSLKAVNRQIEEMRRQVDLTFGQLRAMHEQITEMSQQTEVLDRSVGIAKAAADATLLNAQALIHTERPWVLVEMLSDAPRIGPVEFYTSELPPTGQEPHSACTFHVKNYGRTPAIITAQTYSLHLNQHGLYPNDADLFRSRPVSTFVMPQDVSQTRTAILPRIVSLNARAAIELDVNFVWLCGSIRYRDAIPRDSPTALEYETVFCYLWKNTGDHYWDLGPAQYNRAT